MFISSPLVSYKRTQSSGWDVSLSWFGKERQTRKEKTNGALTERTHTHTKKRTYTRREETGTDREHTKNKIFPSKRLF